MDRATSRHTLRLVVKSESNAMLNIAVKPARILIAAEQPLEALALESMLRIPNNEGTLHEVRVTSDAREIAPLLDKWPFSLLVLDMNITSQSSLEVLHHLSGAITHGRLAVLAITGPDDAVARDCALGAGAGAVLERPLGRDDIQHKAMMALASMPKTGR